MVDPVSPTKPKCQAVPSIDRSNESEYHQIIAYGNGCWENIHGNERPEDFRWPTNTIPVNAEDPTEDEASML
jgi:hypothetical protein